MQRRPNLFIVGAPKCGTTAWVEYLSSHPGIFFSPLKEPHYFSSDFENFRWAKDQASYEGLFEDAGDAQILGEASVQYLYSKDAARNIRAYNPDASIVVFLRDQRTFLPSYHNQLLYNQDEDIADFETAWRLARDGNRQTTPSTCREPAFLDYLAVGRFDEQLQRYVDLFPSSRILVVLYEEWTRAPRETYLKLLSFLGLPDDGRQEFAPVHVAKRHRNTLISRITQRPPGWVLFIARFLRKVTGRSRLNAAKYLRSRNSAAGYSSEVPEKTLDEIEAYFSESNSRLASMLDRLRQAQ